MINIHNISNQNWKNTKISILGAGKSGISAAKLCKYIGAKPFISENRNDENLKKILIGFDHELNGHTNNVLNCKLLIISPGVNPTIPIIKKCKKMGFQ